MSDLDWDDEPLDGEPDDRRTGAFTDQDLIDLRDRLLAEIGRRLKDPAAAKQLTATQLLAASKDLAKLTDRISQEADTPEEIDLFDLVERLPAAQRERHLLAERVRLTDRLARVEAALGEKKKGDG